VSVERGSQATSHPRADAPAIFTGVPLTVCLSFPLPSPRSINNYVYGSNWLLVDGGSIYVLGPQPNSVMLGNFVSNQRKLYGALYTDEGSAYWYIANNVVHDVPEWLHIWIASIHDELVELNWSDQTYQDVHGTNCTVRNNVFVAPGTPLSQWPAAAQDVINAAGVFWQAGPKQQ